jgi:cysteine-rich repeat protein
VGEACDDGNPDPGDGCSATCTVESGFGCMGATRSSCLSLSGAPRGTITFFEAAACPPYWERASAVDGRLIVGSAANVGLAVGAALTDMEDRTHHHAVTAHLIPVSRNIAAASGANMQGAQPSAFDVTFSTGDAPSGLAMVQLTACRSTLGSPSGDAYPPGAVVAFDVASCPAGWSPFADSTGRTLVPTSGAATSVGTALGSGEMRMHSHDWSAEVPSSSVTFAGAAGGGLSLTDGSALPVTGTTAPAWDGIPYVQLQYCRKDRASDGGAVPTGALAFFPGGTCPSDWSTASSDGKYLVGAPPAGTVGGTFGTSGHVHDVNTQVTFGAQGVALVSGCCAGGYRAAGDSVLAGSTRAADGTFPRLELAACVKSSREDVDGGSPDAAAMDATPPVDSSPSVRCGHPGDCSAGEICGTSGLCRPGPCSTSNPCVFGYTCTSGTCQGAANACDKDTDCASGSLCIAGPTGGGACSAAAGQCFDRAQCGANEVCAAGKCTLACASNTDCRDGYHCDTTRGICTVPAQTCAVTNDCPGASSVCVGGACVPGSVGGTCANAGDVWTENGCVPNQAPAFNCAMDGQVGSGGGVPGVSCAAGQICLHHDCWISCDAPNQNACASQPALSACKPVTDNGVVYDACGTAQSLGNQCGANNQTCSGGAVCIDGFCR